MSALTVAEILRKVKGLQIAARRPANDLLAGQYHSVFRGQGIEFDEVREYQPGDDVRTIDWNVTARAGTPYIKRYTEERELSVVFLVDVGASGLFGSRDRSKLEYAAEVASVLMFSALRNDDKVGMMFYADRVHRYFPARKGRAHVLRLVRELVAVDGQPGEADLEPALRYLRNVQKRHAVVFILSDFLAPASRDGLDRLARHDPIALALLDRRERELPDVGLLTLRDAATGRTVQVDTGSGRVRRVFAERAERRRERLLGDLRRSGVDHLVLETGDDYRKALQRLFARRQRRMRA